MAVFLAILAAFIATESINAIRIRPNKVNELVGSFAQESLPEKNETVEAAVVATIVFGGMQANCSNEFYSNFISKLKTGLGQERIDCY